MAAAPVPRATAGLIASALLTKDEETAYVSIRSRNALAVIDLESRTVVAEPWIGKEPDTLQLTPNGETLVVALRVRPRRSRCWIRDPSPSG